MKGESFLTRHLKEADEGYFRHMAFTLKAGGLLIAAGAAVVVHGFFPFAFIHTGSRIVQRLHEELQRRKAACEAGRRA